MKYTVITLQIPIEYRVLKSKREHGLETPVSTTFIIDVSKSVEVSTLQEAEKIASGIISSVILISHV